MSYSKFVPYEMKVSIVKVTSYEDRVIAGSLLNSFYQQEMPFYGIVQLLSLIENIYDEIKSPEQVLQVRGFTEPERSIDLTQCTRTDKTTGPALATFKIGIYFRQNASLQGSVAWEEQDSSANFRSALEMIWLLDSALRENQA